MPDPRTAEERLRATWTCEVTGPVAHADLPGGADFPMRQAVRAAYRALTGQDATELSSGWRLAADPVPAPLDLERLAQALAVADGVGEGIDWAKTPAQIVWAERIATAYAALATPPEPEA